MKIISSDIPKTTFRNRYGYYELFVMSFELTNALTTLIDFTNHVLKAYLNFFVIVFIDYILMYFRREEHELHLKMVL